MWGEVFWCGRDITWLEEDSACRGNDILGLEMSWRDETAPFYQERIPSAVEQVAG